MATSRSCIKRLKGPVKQFFTVSGGRNSSSCTWNSSFPEVLYKKSVLKNSKFTYKHKKQSFEGVLPKKKMSLEILQNLQKNIFVVVPFLIKLQAGNLKLSGAATGDVL